MVALTWIDTTADPDPDKSRPLLSKSDAAVATGFLVETLGLYFWVTAGHVVAAIKKRRDSGRRVLVARFLHGWQGTGLAQATPFPLEDMPSLAINKMDYGLDVGVIPVPHHYARLLIAAGVVAIPRMQWAHKHDLFDEYVVLGLPSETNAVEVSLDSESHKFKFKLGMPLMRVTPIENPPECLQSKYTRIYGKIQSLDWQHEDGAVAITDIDGMSGGPMFGLRDCSDGSVEYKLVGIQSSWANESKVVAACPAKPFLAFLAGKFRDHLTQADDMATAGCHGHSFGWP